MTGAVLEPAITVEEDRVIIATPVESVSGPATCPGNDVVPLEVQLGPDALGKDLVDAACLPTGEAFGTAACRTGPARWHLPTTAVAERIDWVAPETYTFQVSSICGYRAFLGTFEIDVARGEVTGVEALGDRFGESAMDDLVVDAAMTMEDIVDEVNSGGGTRRVALDAQGNPRYVSIGKDLAQSDSSSCYFIHDFTADTASN